MSASPSLNFLLLPSLFLSSKPSWRASRRLRWILIPLWWKTSSVWRKSRRTWRLFSVRSKMTSHAASASEPRQVCVSFPLIVSPFISFCLFLFYSTSTCAPMVQGISIPISTSVLTSTRFPSAGWSRQRKIELSFQVHGQFTILIFPIFVLLAYKYLLYI